MDAVGRWRRLEAGIPAIFEVRLATESGPWVAAVVRSG